MTIEFYHECQPPTATAQQRKFFKGGKSALTPNAAKASATWMAIVEKHAPLTPMTGPIELTVFLTWQRKAVKTAEPKTTRPDLDNCAKLLLDAMTKAGYWKDDAQICRVTMEKFQGPEGGVYIKVQESK